MTKIFVLAWPETCNVVLNKNCWNCLLEKITGQLHMHSGEKILTIGTSISIRQISLSHNVLGEVHKKVVDFSEACLWPLVDY